MGAVHDTFDASGLARRHIQVDGSFMQVSAGASRVIGEISTGSQWHHVPGLPISKMHRTLF